MVKDLLPVAVMFMRIGIHGMVFGAHLSGVDAGIAFKAQAVHIDSTGHGYFVDAGLDLPMLDDDIARGAHVDGKYAHYLNSLREQVPGLSSRMDIG